MIGLVTDSTSQMPTALADRYGIEVVPVPVVIDDHSYLEGVDLDADAFYEMLDADPVPAVKTSQPSPGDIARFYDAVIERGANEILSIHVSPSMSGTLNSARLAADHVVVPVRLVDSGTASFGVSCCMWDAAEAVAAGAGVEEAAGIAERTAATVHSVFIIQSLDFVRRGGRVGAAGVQLADDVPVIRTDGPKMSQIGTGRGVDELCDLMAEAMSCDGRPMRAAVGIADRHAEPFWRGLHERLRVRDDVVDLVSYRVGPSIGAFTGPGTAGGFWYPIS